MSAPSQSAPSHVKLTNHFLAAMQDYMPRRDQLWLLDALVSGRLLATAADHCDGQRRIAICSGQGYVVAGLEDGTHQGLPRPQGKPDHSMLVLLTYLPADRAACLQLRSDTAVVPLSVVACVRE